MLLVIKCRSAVSKKTDALCGNKLMFSIMFSIWPSYLHNETQSTAEANEEYHLLCMYLVGNQSISIRQRMMQKLPRLHSYKTQIIHTTWFLLFYHLSCVAAAPGWVMDWLLQPVLRVETSVSVWRVLESRGQMKCVAGWSQEAVGALERYISRMTGGGIYWPSLCQKVVLSSV